jgi:hypothetical protein
MPDASDALTGQPARMHQLASRIPNRIEITPRVVPAHVVEHEALAVRVDLRPVSRS